MASVKGEHSMSPFSNLRVLELASVLAGPLTGMFFAQLGAQVTKVEHPITGDVTRGWHHPMEDTASTQPAYFCSANWGKTSLPLDFTRADDLEKVRDLIADSDIVITSFKPGDEDKFGLSAASIQRINSNAIVASINGFGAENSRVAYDAVVQAESGFMSMNGTPASGPVKMPVALIDVLTSHHVREAILVQLISGDRTPITVSLVHVAVCSLVNQASNVLMTGAVPQRMGTEHPNICPYGMLFTTKDNRQILLACGSERHVQKVLSFFGKDELYAEPWMSTNSLRVQHRELVRQSLQECFSQVEASEFLTFAHANSIPAGEVRDVAAVLSDPSNEHLLLRNGEFAAVSTIASNLPTVSVSRPPGLETSSN